MNRLKVRFFHLPSPRGNSSSNASSLNNSSLPPYGMVSKDSFSLGTLTWTGSSGSGWHKIDAISRSIGTILYSLLVPHKGHLTLLCAADSYGCSEQGIHPMTAKHDELQAAAGSLAVFKHIVQSNILVNIDLLLHGWHWSFLTCGTRNERTWLIKIVIRCIGSNNPF